MSLFGNLKEKTKNAEDTKDSLGGGFGAKETDVYTGDVKVAYVGKADSGADWIQLIIENMKTSDGLPAGEFRAQVYFTSGKEKGNKPTYEKNGKEYYLPGYTVVNDMLLMATGTELFDADFEEKIVKVYDFDQKAEVNKSVMVPVDLIGCNIMFAIEKTIESKQSKGDDGKYHDNGETREANEIQKVFHPELLVTVVEAREAEKAEKELTPELAVFREAWLEKNKGKTRDKTKGSAGATGKGGVPPKPGANGSSSAPAGGKSLFGKK